MIIESKTVAQPAHPEPAPEQASALAPMAQPGWGAPFRSLLWCEWFAHSRVLLAFLVLWLAGVWLLPLFTHSAWVLFVGVSFALIAGPVYGGGDTIEGCEELSFSLPATRAERYLARLTVAGGALLLFTLLDLLALGDRKST